MTDQNLITVQIFLLKANGAFIAAGPPVSTWCCSRDVWVSPRPLTLGFFLLVLLSLGALGIFWWGSKLHFLLQSTWRCGAAKHYLLKIQLWFYSTWVKSRRSCQRSYLRQLADSHVSDRVARLTNFWISCSFPLHSLISPNAGEIVFVSSLSESPRIFLLISWGRFVCWSTLILKGWADLFCSFYMRNKDAHIIIIYNCSLVGCIFVGIMLTGCSAVLFVMAAIPYWTRLRKCVFSWWTMRNRRKSWSQIMDTR